MGNVQHMERQPPAGIGHNSNPYRMALTEPQEAMFCHTAQYPAFVAGFGAGKSEVMTYCAIRDAMESATAIIGCYAPTYDLIRLITVPRLIEKLTEAGIPHKHNQQHNVIYTSWPRMGDFVMRNMDNPARIVGYETYRSHVDELDTLKPKLAKDVWNKIIARNRQKPEGLSRPVNRVSAYTTPEGFRFVYDRWVTNGGGQYQIIQAPTYSNPRLPVNYVQNLRDSYPANLIDAYIEGRFVNLTSGTVYRSYDRVVHRSAETIRPKEDLYIGQDFNVGDMASAICVRRPSGWHCVGEIMGALDTPDLIVTLDERYPDHKIYMYPDASGDSKKSVDASKTDLSLLRTAKITIRAKKANPPIKDRVLAVNSAYQKGRLWINDSEAPTVATSQEQQAYATSGMPDKTTGHDHANDALGYLVYYEMPVIKQTFTTRDLDL